MYKVLIVLCSISFTLFASERGVENQIKALLKQAKTSIENESTFEAKVSVLESLRANVIVLEQAQDIRGNLKDPKEYMPISYLVTAFESLNKLQSYEYLEANGELGSINLKLITRKNCPDALTRIHVDFDPQSEIPRLPSPVDSLYGMIQSVCSAID
ncbi:hypothetical protein A3758_14420 [Oleiphilus sp. HI0118]|nr:hypothetical protein A3758_14420 [Oleiphilus sp. HI0118]